MPLLEGKRVLLTGASGFIGTNLVPVLVACGAEVINADIVEPLDPAHQRHWRRCDVMDLSALTELTEAVDPHFIVHLAARTDTLSDDPEGYALNHVGTMNARSASTAGVDLQRFVFVSTQYVLGPGITFESEAQYAPHTAYGESKAEAERRLRKDPPPVCWTIVRPTNVWGPWHLRYQQQFWRVVRKGFYVHPSSPDPVRSYGYIGSVCLQILAALLVDEKRVHGRALYIGDDPVRLSTWVDAFSVALRRRPARRVPGRFVKALAKVGDRAAALGLPSLITSSRFTAMTQDYSTPMSHTWDALGARPVVEIGEGVAETVAWLCDARPAPVANWLEAYQRATSAAAMPESTPTAPRSGLDRTES